jgi:endo-1,4-beta-D-glucanase Y
MQHIEDQREYLVNDMLQRRKQLIRVEGDYKDQPKFDPSYLIPAINSKNTTQLSEQSQKALQDKQRLLMAISENVFSENYFFYFHLWRQRENTTNTDDVNLYYKKL